jgi:hypothetical protein
MRRLFAFYTLMLAITPAFSQTHNGAGLDSERLKLIRPRLQELVDDGTIPGAVALVARHGETATLEAVGWSDVNRSRR